MKILKVEIENLIKSYIYDQLSYNYNDKPIRLKVIDSIYNLKIKVRNLDKSFNMTNLISTNK